MMITAEHHRAAEVAWTDLQRRLWHKLPESLAPSKPRVGEIGGALVSMMVKSTALQINSVFGLGIAQPASASIVDQIIELYGAAGVDRFCVYLSPAARPSTIRRRLLDRGFDLAGNHVKLFRSLDEPIEVPATPEVRRIGPDHAEIFARILCKQYGWPEKRVPWLGGMVGESAFDHFLAFINGRPVATGVLYAAGRIGVLAWGSTATPFRRRGAQSALIAARLARARELELDWVMVETIEPARGRPAVSFRNLIRAGFTVDKLMPCFVWEGAGRASRARPVHADRTGKAREEKHDIRSR